MEKIKLQIYLTKELHSKLLEEAEKNGISVPATIIDILNERYGDTDKESEADITANIINEFKNYAAKLEDGTEFTIHEASPTFLAYPQYRARLGKKIALAVAEGKYTSISAVRTRSGFVKRRGNGAAVYVKKLSDDKCSTEGVSDDKR